MKIIHEPSVYLLGRQTVDDNELERFLAEHGVSWQTDTEVAAEVLTETAGRVCYMSFAKPRPGGNAAYLGHILEVGHGSVLEHGVWNFLFTGISRSLTHELIRHRAGMGYSQLSQRYVDESVAEYVEPMIIANDPELHALWLDTVSHSHRLYVELAEKLSVKFAGAADPDCEKCHGSGMILIHPKGVPFSQSFADIQDCGCEIPPTAKRKIARQAARSVLPNATETKIFVTANARSLRHFLEQRGSRHAEPEIRLLANRLLDVLVKEAPNLFGDYRRLPLPDGTFEINTVNRKV